MLQHLLAEPSTPYYFAGLTLLLGILLGLPAAVRLDRRDWALLGLSAVMAALLWWWWPLSRYRLEGHSEIAVELMRRTEPLLEDRHNVWASPPGVRLLAWGLGWWPGAGERHALALSALCGALWSGALAVVARRLAPQRLAPSGERPSEATPLWPGLLVLLWLGLAPQRLLWSHSIYHLVIPMAPLALALLVATVAVRWRHESEGASGLWQRWGWLPLPWSAGLLAGWAVAQRLEVALALPALAVLTVAASPGPPGATPAPAAPQAGPGAPMPGTGPSWLARLRTAGPVLIGIAVALAPVLLLIQRFAGASAGDSMSQVAAVFWGNVGFLGLVAPWFSWGGFMAMGLLLAAAVSAQRAEGTRAGEQGSNPADLGRASGTAGPAAGRVQNASGGSTAPFWTLPAVVLASLPAWAAVASFDDAGPRHLLAARGLLALLLSIELARAWAGPAGSSPAGGAPATRVLAELRRPRAMATLGAGLLTLVLGRAAVDARTRYFAGEEGMASFRDADEELIPYEPLVEQRCGFITNNGDGICRTCADLRDEYELVNWHERMLDVQYAAGLWNHFDGCVIWARDRDDFQWDDRVILARRHRLEHMWQWERLGWAEMPWGQAELYRWTGPVMEGLIPAPRPRSLLLTALASWAPRWLGTVQDRWWCATWANQVCGWWSRCRHAELNVPDSLLQDGSCAQDAFTRCWARAGRDLGRWPDEDAIGALPPPIRAGLITCSALDDDDRCLGGSLAASCAAAMEQ